jgi:hypothetical protein
MRKRPKRPTDINLVGRQIVEEATGQKFESKKNPAAVMLGGLGGAARAKKLTPQQRQEIAKKGAVARWRKHA